MTSHINLVQPSVPVPSAASPRVTNNSAIAARYLSALRPATRAEIRVESTSAWPRSAASIAGVQPGARVLVRSSMQGIAARPALDTASRSPPRAASMIGSTSAPASSAPMSLPQQRLSTPTRLLQLDDHVTFRDFTASEKRKATSRHSAEPFVKCSRLAASLSDASSRGVSDVPSMGARHPTPKAETSAWPQSAASIAGVQPGARAHGAFVASASRSALTTSAGLAMAKADLPIHSSMQAISEKRKTTSSHCAEPFVKRSRLAAGSVGEAEGPWRRVGSPCCAALPGTVLPAQYQWLMQDYWWNVDTGETTALGASKPDEKAIQNEESTYALGAVQDAEASGKKSFDHEPDVQKACDENSDCVGYMLHTNGKYYKLMSGSTTYDSSVSFVQWAKKKKRVKAVKEETERIEKPAKEEAERKEQAAKEEAERKEKAAIEKAERNEKAAKEEAGRKEKAANEEAERKEKAAKVDAERKEKAAKEKAAKEEAECKEAATRKARESAEREARIAAQQAAKKKNDAEEAERNSSQWRRMADGNWRKILYPASGRSYLWNVKTGVTSWTKTH